MAPDGEVNNIGSRIAILHKVILRNSGGGLERLFFESGHFFERGYFFFFESGYFFFLKAVI